MIKTNATWRRSSFLLLLEVIAKPGRYISVCAGQASVGSLLPGCLTLNLATPRPWQRQTCICGEELARPCLRLLLFDC